MPFDEKTYLKVVDHVSRKWTQSACPFCASNDWAVQGPVEVSLVQHVRHLDAPYMPSAAIICNKCGYMALLNLGVVDKSSG